MKLRVGKGSLIQILQRVQSITEKKTTMSVLSNVMLKASDEQKLEFLATDLQLSAWISAEAQVEISGSVTISARKFLEVIREVPGDQVSIETLANDKVLIQAGRARFELSTIPAESFPHVTFYEDGQFVKCDAQALRKAFEQAFYVIPQEEDPYSIAGLFWHPVGENYRFVSSDGHRLAYSEVPMSVFETLDVGNGVIIPRKAVQEATRLLEKEIEAWVSIYENCLILKTPDSILSSQLLEGEFPEYDEIIPEERPFSVTVEREILHSALKRMLVLSNQKWRHVRFIITRGCLGLEAGNPEIGVASDELDVEYGEEDFAVAFNTRYVMEAIQVIESSHVRFEWVDNFHGGVFVGADDPGYISLVMPMVV